MTRLATILSCADNGAHVEQIATALGVSTGYIYGVLREHRPTRTRKPRERTSDVPRMIAALAAEGHKPHRIAVMLGITRAYVYRHLPQEPGA